MARSSRALAADIMDIERRMQALDWQLSRLKGNARTASAGISAGVSQATDRVGDVLTAALAEVADRFRGLRNNSRSIGDEATRFGNEAMRMGSDAARFGGDALNRVAAQVERRPLILLAVAAGVGVLVGLIGRKN